MFVVYRPVVKDGGFLRLGLLKYGVCFCKGYDGCFPIVL